MTQATYDIHEVPARGDERSRFALPKSPAGWSIRPDENVANVYLTLADEWRETLEPDGGPQDYELARVARTEDGAYALVSYTVRATPEYRNQRPARFSKVALRAGAALDSFFAGEEAWKGYRDEAIFEEARALAEQEGFQGEAIRRLNRALAVAILARAGCRADATALPV